MVRIYTLTLAPSLDSATITPQIYPEGKLRCTSPVLNPVVVVLTWPAPLLILAETQRLSFRLAALPGNTVSLLADENVPVATIEAKDWTRQNLHVHVESSGEQYRFVMPGQHLPMTSSTSFRIRCWKLSPARCW